MKIRRRFAGFPALLALAIPLFSLAAQARDRWTEAQAQTWQAKQPPILTGGNFLPSA